MAKSIWLLSDTLEPRGRTSSTLRLAQALPEYGFEPTLLCRSAASIPTRLRRELAICELPRLYHGMVRLLPPHFWMTGLPENPPALIHAQHANLDTLALSLADRLDIPYVVSVQEVLAAEQSFSVSPDRLGAIIAVSPSVRDDLVHAANVPEALIWVIPNGVEVSMDLTLTPPRDERKIPIVGTASALEEAKGLTYFLMAAELILSSGHDVEFVIAGSGPEEETLRRLAQHLDIANRVTFVPYLLEYSRVLDTFDVFVLPSLQQGLGTIMLEAMALGKPVVATNVGGVADFCVDNLHALLVPPANHIILAEKIRHLLDYPQKARKLAIAGQQLVRHDFSIDRMAHATAQLYEQILSAQPQQAAT